MASPSAGRPIATSPTGRTGNGRCSTRTAFSRAGAPGWHEAAWRDLGRLHDGLDAAKRWYARQRLASRYLENGVACGRAILLLADLLTGRAIARADVTAETALSLEGGAPFVMGWPLDAATATPRPLRFEEGARPVIEGCRARYAVALPAPDAGVLLEGAGGPSIRCSGEGLEALLPDIVPLAAPAGEGAADIDVTLVADGEPLRRLAARGEPRPSPSRSTAARTPSSTATFSSIRSREAAGSWSSRRAGRRR